MTEDLRKVKKKWETENKEGFPAHSLVYGCMFSYLVRWFVAGYPYSGQNKPPMFGDYEAQRHWQEITLHLPFEKWYINSTQNDLQYWGLDYPPLTAYHSYLLATIAEYIQPESVRFFASRGYESEDHKIFMRWTVFLADLYIYVNAVLCICKEYDKSYKLSPVNIFKKIEFALPLFLLYPGLILIDYGHFQYNVVSLGFFLWSCYFLLFVDNDVMASICFVCAINYKQMELYHALPIFIFLLRSCVDFKSQLPQWITFVTRIIRLGICVLTVFIIIWIPFLKSWEMFTSVLIRVFPLGRGVFEDKVSNIWCAINVVIKLKTLFDNFQMAKICLLATMLAATPSCLDLFLRSNKRKLILSFINVSLAFFLCSFQVHEKTILLCAIPALVHLPEDPFMVFWFLLVTNFSMLPLLVKDGLTIAFIGCSVIYVTFYSFCFQFSNKHASFFSFLSANYVYKSVQQHKELNSSLYSLLSLIFSGSCIGMIVLFVLFILVSPPPHLPDLFPLLISVYSCAHFIMFYIYFNYQQLMIPKENIIKTKVH